MARKRSLNRFCQDWLPGYRHSPLSFAAFLFVCLSGCVAAQPPSFAIASVRAAPAFTLETPIERIAADPRGRAVLNKNIPGLLTNPSYPMFKSMNLKLLASLSGGKLDKQTLADTSADLAALPKQASLK